jgi:hypothetical protein
MKRTAHGAAAVIAAMALALWSTGCTGGAPTTPVAGGSPHPAGPSGAPSSGATSSGATSSGATSSVAYSACMRSHGVPNFPDPGDLGGVPKGDAQHFGVSDSQLQAAQQSCQSLLPTSGSLKDLAAQCSFAGDCPPALVQQMENAMLKFAQCMRAHGFPKFPDPTTDDHGAPILSWSVSQSGADPDSSRYQAAEAQCQSQGGLPGPRRVLP